MTRAQRALKACAAPRHVYMLLSEMWNASWTVRWVATDCCRPFDEALAQPAAEAVAGPEGGAAEDGGRHSQALKLAVQLHHCGEEVRTSANCQHA